MRYRTALLLVALLAACQGSGAAPVKSGPDGAGVLTGRVTRGPTAAVTRPGAVDSAAAAGVEIRIRGRDGTPVSTVRTDARGVYRVTLPPGTYEIVIGPLTGIEFTKDLPATVTIVRDRETTLDVRIDTGVR
jgi:type 1 fimbria pilin